MSNNTKHKPRFKIGDRVLRSSNTIPPGLDRPMVYSGTVTQVLTATEYLQLINSRHGTAALNTIRKIFSERDKDYLKSHVYIIEPDSSPGLAPYEEATIIIPGLSREQYDMLTNRRSFDCIDSDLLPMEWFDV